MSSTKRSIWFVKLSRLLLKLRKPNFSTKVKRMKTRLNVKRTGYSRRESTKKEIARRKKKKRQRRDRWTQRSGIRGREWNYIPGNDTNDELINEINT